MGRPHQNPKPRPGPSFSGICCPWGPFFFRTLEVFLECTTTPLALGGCVAIVVFLTLLYFLDGKWTEGRELHPFLPSLSSFLASGSPASSKNLMNAY
jgi:hypothetical protein